MMTNAAMSKKVNDAITGFLCNWSLKGIRKAEEYCETLIKADSYSYQRMMDLMVFYLITKDKSIPEKIITLSDVLSPFERSKILVMFSAYLSGELKEKCISKALSISLSPEERMEICLILHNFDMKERTYLDMATEYARMCLGLTRYRHKVAEVFVCRMADLGEDTFTEAESYISKHAFPEGQQKGSSTALVDYDALYRFMYENTGDEKYHEHELSPASDPCLQPTYWTDDGDLCHSRRFLKYMRLNDFENHLLLLERNTDDLQCHDPYINDALGYYMNWETAIWSANFDCLFRKDHSYFDRIFNDIILRLGLEMIFKHSKEGSSLQIQYFYETLGFPKYLKENFITSKNTLFRQKWMYDDFLQMGQKDYHFGIADFFKALSLMEESNGLNEEAYQLLSSIDFAREKRFIRPVHEKLEEIAFGYLTDEKYSHTFERIFEYLKDMYRNDEDFYEEWAHLCYNAATYYLNIGTPGCNLRKGKYYLGEAVRIYSYPLFLDKDVNHLMDITDYDFLCHMREYTAPVQKAKTKEEK